MLDETAQLLADLKDLKPEVRARAARVIGNTGGAAVIEQLIQTLGDTDPKVFAAAKTALMRLSPQANEAVIRALDSEDNLICSGAVELAGEMNLRPTLDKVRALVHNPDREIKIAAATALARLEGEKSTDSIAPLLEDPDPRIRLHAVKVLGSLQMATHSVAASSSLRGSAQPAAGKRPQKAAGPLPSVSGGQQPGTMNPEPEVGSAGLLTPRLRDNDPDVRRATIDILARIGDRNCVEDLRSLEDDPDSQIADAARQALVSIGERAVGPYLENLSHKDVGARLAALDTLIKQGKAAVLPLMAMLEHRNPAVRVLVADVLGSIADPRALDGLTRALEGRDRRVRLAAIAAIGRLNTQAAVARLLEALESGDTEFADIAARSLVNAGTAISQHIIDLLRAPNSELRTRAARILGQIREPLALAPLTSALRDTDEWVRAAAALALGNLLDPSATESLIVCLHDVHPSVRAAAADALGQLRDLSAREPLLPLLQDRQASVRAAAARALGRIGDNIAAEPVTGLLDDPDREVRIAAIQALGSLRVVKVLERLQSIANPWPASLEHRAVKRAARQAASAILKAKEEDEELMKAQVESSQSTKVTYQ
jgi:HEAT repeat protein